MNKKTENRGGKREPRPGKKIGRPPKNKKKQTYTLSKKTIEALEEASQKSGFTKSDIVEGLLSLLPEGVEWHTNRLSGKLIIISERTYIRMD